jgi:hypothetical protein
MGAMASLKVQVPGENYHRDLVSCQAACPVHTDARGTFAPSPSGMEAGRK